MKRRTFIAGIAALGLTRSMIRHAGAEQDHTHVEQTWDTTTANRIERLTVSIRAFTSEEDARTAIDERRGDVKDGTLYEESTKTFGDESFIVHYQYPYMSSYEGNSRVGSVVVLVVWDAIFIDGHVEGHRVFESIVDRIEPQESYTESDLEAMLPTDDDLTELELR